MSDASDVVDSERCEKTDELALPTGAVKPAAVVERANAQTPSDQAGVVLALIERASRDNEIDLDRMDRLMGMHERLLADQRKQAFEAAFSAMQGDLPTVTRGKDPSYQSRKSGYVKKPNYAPWEAIWTAIAPVLKAHGFSLRFYTDTAPNAPIVVRAHLAHKDGHAEETSMVVPHEGSGDKNAIQAMASSITYAKRYTGCAILNITTEDEDTDANKTLSGKPLSAAQVTRLRKALEYMDGDEGKLLEWAAAAGMKADSLEDMASEHFDRLNMQLAYWTEKRAGQADE